MTSTSPVEFGQYRAIHCKSTATGAVWWRVYHAAMVDPISDHPTRARAVAAIMRMHKAAPRAPYAVVVRRITTGADYSAVVYLRNESDAFAVMARKANVAFGAPAAFLRLVSCTPATAAQIADHKARLASI